jgi:hypothetical protein
MRSIYRHQIHEPTFVWDTDRSSCIHFPSLYHCTDRTFCIHFPSVHHCTDAKSLYLSWNRQKVLHVYSFCAQTLWVFHCLGYRQNILHMHRHHKSFVVWDIDRTFYTHINFLHIHYESFVVWDTDISFYMHIYSYQRHPESAYAWDTDRPSPNIFLSI